MKMAKPGRGERTRPKHALMDRLIGNEIGCVGVHRTIRRSIILDLTAGDGVPYQPEDSLLPPLWERNTSPGLAAYHARNAKRPTSIFMFEIAPANYDRLLRSFDENLPRLGYKSVGLGHWTFENMVTLSAVNESGSTVDVESLRIDRLTSVLVLNDPNAITTWAMPRDLMASLSARTPWSRSISTMGCNVSGLKRGEKLRQWKPHIDGIVEPLLSHHDLFLARIERDASQFAYLIETSKKDLWRTRLENDAVVCFGRCGFQSAWLRPDDREFWRIVNVLLKTKEEQKKEELR